MAIVKVIQTGTATVKIDDSCFSGLSREALAERWAEVRRAIIQIDREEGKRKCIISKGSNAVIGLLPWIEHQSRTYAVERRKGGTIYE